MSVLTKQQRATLQGYTDKYCKLGNIKRMTNIYKAMGDTGGSCDVHKWVININQDMAAQNFHEYENIVIHEIAHAVDFVRNKRKWRRNGRGRIFHDKVFKSIMVELAANFAGLDTSTCHTMPSVSKRKQRRWEYSCDCSETHSIATVTHNRIQKGVKAFNCNDCGEKIKFTGNQV